MTSANDDSVLFERVALIGIGLIGSSLAHALRRHGLTKHIAVTARTAASRETASRLGLADSLHDTARETVRDADLVVICTPVSAYESIASDMGPALKPGAIVTDVGSVKQAVVRDVMPYLPDGVHFVPGHPIAGTENSGPEAGFAELFERRWCVLTPVPGSHEEAVEQVAALWRAFGAMVEIMEPQHHDKILAITSHLPHLIAYTIVGTAVGLEESDRAEVVKFSAGGFRDFTRIAASDPIMWRDVFLNNREAVLEMLQRFSEDLTALQRAIRWGEGDILQDLFQRTRAIRRGIVDAHQAGTFDPREPESSKLGGGPVPTTPAPAETAPAAREKSGRREA